MSRVHTAFLALPMLGALAGPCVAASATQSETLSPQLAQATSTVIIAPTAPPPLRAEIVPPPPTSETTTVVWQQGHWAWSGNTWVWVTGQYVQPPAPRTVWDPGHWVQQAGGTWMWVDGHWRSG